MDERTKSALLDYVEDMKRQCTALRGEANRLLSDENRDRNELLSLRNRVAQMEAVKREEEKEQEFTKREFVTDWVNAQKSRRMAVNLLRKYANLSLKDAKILVDEHCGDEK